MPYICFETTVCGKNLNLKFLVHTFSQTLPLHLLLSPVSDQPFIKKQKTNHFTCFDPHLLSSTLSISAASFITTAHHFIMTASSVTLAAHIHTRFSRTRLNFQMVTVASNQLKPAFKRALEFVFLNMWEFK